MERQRGNPDRLLGAGAAGKFVLSGPATTSVSLCP